MLKDFFSVPWQFLWLNSKSANAVNIQAILGLNSKLMVDFGQDQSLCWYLLRKRFLFRDIKNFTLHTNVILTFGSRIFQSVSKIWSYLVSLLFNWVLDWSRILRDSLVSRQFKNLESRQTFLLLIQTIATLIVSFVVNSASW